MLNISGWLGAAAVIFLWVTRERYGLDESTLMIISGLALANLVLRSADRRRCNDNYNMAMRLMEQRENMSREDFSDKADFFFDDTER